MINKELFFNEVDELITINKSIDKNDFELLYFALKKEKGEINVGFLADKIVKNLSGGIFTKEIMISWEFLQTEIGRALIKAKFEMGNDIYFTSDVADITGYSKQFIGQEIKSGNIEYEKRKGIIFFRESSLNRYLTKKKINALEKKHEIVYECQKEKLISVGFEGEEDYNVIRKIDKKRTTPKITKKN